MNVRLLALVFAFAPAFQPLPAPAAIGTVGVFNASDRCAMVQVYAGGLTGDAVITKTSSKMTQVKAGKTVALIVRDKAGKPARHVVVRAYMTRNVDCSGGPWGVTQAERMSPGAALEVPVARIVNWDRPKTYRVVFP